MHGTRGKRIGWGGRIETKKGLEVGKGLSNLKLLKAPFGKILGQEKYFVKWKMAGWEHVKDKKLNLLKIVASTARTEH